MSFTAGLIDFPEKRAPTKVKYLLPVGSNFTDGNAGKLTVSFALGAQVDVIKYRKNTDVFLRARADYLSFRPQRACDRKTIGTILNQSARAASLGYNIRHDVIHMKRGLSKDLTPMPIAR